MKKLAATFDFSDFAKSITYFCYFTTTGRSKTLDSFMENLRPTSSRKKTKRSQAMMPIGGPKSDQTAVGDAIRKTPQDTKKLYTRKLSSSMEYQGAVQKYQALTKKTCKFVPRFRPYKVRRKRLRDDANPGQGQAQMPGNGTRKVAQGHPKRTKMVRN